jgi:hypothetical protein
MSKNPFDVNFNVTIAVASGSFRATALALFYDALGAMESGGRNRGKIVRAVMEGKEGAAYEWCAGIATNCYILAARLLKRPNPFARLGRMRWSSSGIYRHAKTNGWLTTKPQNGDLFLVRGGRTGYKHTGMVARVQKERVVTIEGNVDDQVLIRNRRRTGLVFVHVAD